MKSSKRANYRVYAPLLEFLKNGLRKQYRKELHKKSDREMTKLAVKKYVRKLAVDNLLYTIDGANFIDEYHWSKDKNILFPASADVLERLYRSKFQIKDVGRLIQTSERFVLAAPKGFCIDGVKMPSCLVSIYDENNLVPDLEEVVDIAECTNPSLRAEISQRAIEGFQRACNPNIPESKWYISINFPDANCQAAIRTTVRLDKLTETLQVERPENIGDKLSKFESAVQGDPKTTIGAVADVDDVESAQQYILLKIVAAILVYRAADPSVIKKGFPSNYARSKGEPEFESTPAASTLSLTGKAPRDASRAHYRSFHFRQLMSDRYYQGEYEHLPKGSRVVFVKESFVGAKIRPETVV